MMMLKRPFALILMILASLAVYSDAWAGFAEGVSAYEAGNFAAAYDEWQPLAEAGDPDAQLAIGILYENGRGVAQDYREAINWYTKAAEAGHAGAQFNLGNMYRQGLGVSQNPARGVLWWTLAAEQGLPAAMLNLGIAYHLGEGVAQDPVRAFELFKGAADAGIPTAQFSAAYAYENGLGTQQDLAEARRLYGLAAEAGMPQAAERLAALDQIEVEPLMTMAPVVEPDDVAETAVVEDVESPALDAETDVDATDAAMATEPEIEIVGEVAMATQVEEGPEDVATDLSSVADEVDVGPSDEVQEPAVAIDTGGSRWPYIQLAAFQTEGRAETAWRDLTTRFPDLLGDLPYRVQTMTLSSNATTIYGLQAGPMPDRTEAEAVCSALRTRDADCFLINP